MRFPSRRARHAPPPPAPPEGWPSWLPRPGGSTARDLLPTQRLWDISRLFHRDDTVSDGWPAPVLPAMATTSLCDALGRRVAAVPTPSEDQARGLLTALGGDGVHSAVLGVTSDDVLDRATANGWPVVAGHHVRPDAPTEQVVFVRELTFDDAVALLGDGDVLLLWSEDWIIAGDPSGEESSSLVVGVSGTAERLRQTGLDVLPVGHAATWPPHCLACNPGSDPHAGHAHG